MEKNGAGFRGILPMFKNDRSWFDCVEFIENSFEIYQVRSEERRVGKECRP